MKRENEKTKTNITICIIAIIAIAGIIKFNVLQDDIYIKNADGTVEKYDEAKHIEEQNHSEVMLKLFNINTSNDFEIKIPEENLIATLNEFVLIDSTTEMAKGEYANGVVRGNVFLDFSKIRTPNIGNSRDSFYFVAPFIVSNQGSGSFYYLGLFEHDVKKLSIKHLDSYFLGDRIRITSIKTDLNILEIELKVHSIKESMADEPSAKRKLKLKVTTTQFIEERKWILFEGCNEL